MMLQRAEPRAGARPGSRRWAGLAVLSASLLVVVMGLTILIVALPELTVAVGAGPVAQLWIVDAYSLVLVGFTIFGVASAAVLLANSSAAVIGIRVFLGIGGSMIMPATLSLVRSLFPDARERAFALGIWGTTAAVGAAVGPFAGGLLLEHFSWHAAFLVNVPLMVVAVVAGRLLLPESRSARPGRIDAAGVVLSIVAMTSLVFAVKHLGKDGVDLLAVSLVAVGLTTGTVFVRRSLHQPDPMLAVRLFANPLFRAGISTALVTNFALTGVLLIGAQWLQLVEGFSPLQVGAGLLPLAVGGLVGPPLAPAVANRIGVRPVIVGGLAFLGIGMLVLAVLPRPMSYPGVGLALLVVGLGTTSLALASAVIMGAAPVDQAGSAAAMEEMSYEVGAVLGVTILGSIAGAVYRAGLPGDAPGAVVDSLGYAVGTPFAGAASEAFTASFAVLGLVAGLLSLGIALLVRRLLPRHLDLGMSHD